MALAPVLSSLYSQFLNSRPLVPSCSGSKRYTNPSVIYSKNLRVNSSVETEESGCQSNRNRRDLVVKTLLATFSFPTIAPLFAYADTPPPAVDEFRVYTDDVNKFKIVIPQDWQVGAGDGNSIKSVTAFFPGEAANSNVSVVITGLGPDFTRLESFGKVDSFAENLVSGLDRSWQKPPGVTAKLIDSKAANGLFIYTSCMN